MEFENVPPFAEPSSSKTESCLPSPRRCERHANAQVFVRQAVWLIHAGYGRPCAVRSSRHRLEVPAERPPDFSRQTERNAPALENRLYALFAD